MAATTIERQLHKLRRRIAEVSQISGHLAENFAPLEALAEEILSVLAQESSIAGRRVRSLVEAENRPFDRVLALESGLARAAEYDRLQHSPLSADELRDMVSRRSLDFASQLRAVYSFTVAGDDPWRHLEAELLAGESGEQTAPASDPVIRALRTLAAPSWHALRPMHRLAAERARAEPLGFARLVIEEALTLLRANEWPNFAPLAYVGELLMDPFLAAPAPRIHADLLARVSFYLAEHHAVGPSGGEHRHWLDRARSLIGEGTGDPELRALYFEAKALRAVRQGRIHQALRNLLRANVLLTEVPPVDRRAETLLRYALVLGHHPGSGHQAPLVLETALAWLTELQDEVQPGLRLRLLHFLADIEIRGVFAKVADRHPLAALGDEVLSPEVLSPEVLAAGARSWADGLAEHLRSVRSATAHIRAAEQLYDKYGTPRLRAHRSWIVGRALLATTPELASIYLLDANRAFESRGDMKRASLSLRDVMLCHALLGKKQQCAEALQTLVKRGICSESSVEALDDLTLLSHDLLPDARRRSGDQEMSEVLELDNLLELGPDLRVG